MPDPKKSEEKAERTVHSTTTASASRAELISEQAAERAQERVNESTQERSPERVDERTSDERSSDRRSGPLARAGESGDPDVHFLMAERQTHQSVLDALDDPTADRTRQEARDAIEAIDAKLAEMGFEVA